MIAALLFQADVSIDLADELDTVVDIDPAGRLRIQQPDYAHPDALDPVDSADTILIAPKDIDRFIEAVQRAASRIPRPKE